MFISAETQSYLEKPEYVSLSEIAESVLLREIPRGDIVGLLASWVSSNSRDARLDIRNKECWPLIVEVAGLIATAMQEQHRVTSGEEEVAAFC